MLGSLTFLVESWWNRCENVVKSWYRSSSYFPLGGLYPALLWGVSGRGGKLSALSGSEVVYARLATQGAPEFEHWLRRPEPAWITLCHLRGKAQTSPVAAVLAGKTRNSYEFLGIVRNYLWIPRLFETLCFYACLWLSQRIGVLHIDHQFGLAWLGFDFDWIWLIWLDLAWLGLIMAWLDSRIAS